MTTGTKRLTFIVGIVNLLACICVWQGEVKALKEQLRQKEEQLQANQQQSSLLAAELRDASSTRDRTMSELYRMKLEVDALRQAKTDAQAQCVRLECFIEQMKTEAQQEAVRMRADCSNMTLIMLSVSIRSISNHFLIL